MTHPNANDRLLRLTLWANAAFSAVAALAFVAAPAAVAALLFARDFTLLGASPATLILELGIGLLIFAGFVAYTAWQKTIGLGQAKLIVLADLLWVVDSAVVLVAFPAFLTTAGFYGVLAVAAIVLVLAIDQVVGIARVRRGEAASANEAPRDRVSAASGR